jgi:DNA-binding NtrC family response regulator
MPRGYSIATGKAFKRKTGREMSAEIPLDKQLRLDRQLCESAEWERRRRELQLLLACRRRLATASAAQGLSSPLSAYLVLLNVELPDQDGIVTLQQLYEAAPDAKVVMVSRVAEAGSEAQTLDAVAQNSITKMSQMEQLPASVNELVNADAEKGSSPAVLIDELDEDICMVVSSPAMRRVRQRAVLVAKETIPVLILGESGTGKEVIAHFIHSRSPRAAKPFLKINCAALPAELLESELFGYEQGAFTGATSAKPGKFEQCGGGSILLDEIGEVSTALQAKLLQVLHDKSFSRLGSRKEMKIDVRIMAATNVNVPQALAEGTLREDLYYRLNGITLEIPPLRERKEDIPLLLKHFGARLAERYACPAFVPSQKLVKVCLDYAWPGNVRELINFVKRALVMCDENDLLEELQDSTQLSLQNATEKRR